MIDYTREIQVTLQDFRREALTRFIHEFMMILTAEGYTFEDLLDAIATWAAEKPELEEVVKRLEEAELEMRRR